MPPLIFVGAGGIGIVAADIARLQGFDIAGFLDDDRERHGTTFCDAPILGDLQLMPELRRQGLTEAVVAIGHCSRRAQLAEKIMSLGFVLPKIIHPSALISRYASVGDGAILMPGTIINAGTRVGSNIILNTAASVDHDCQVGNAVHIGPGSRLSGLVTVGSLSYLGVGSVVRESIQIGSNVLIGAGSLVLKNIPDDVVAFGAPAKVIRPNQR